MFWPFPMGNAERPEPRFQSSMSLAPDCGVVLLGAGASVEAGCPVMRGFIDRGRDYLVQNVFSDSEQVDVRNALRLYEVLRTSFSITEEDIENVENILSLCDLAKVIGAVPISGLAEATLSDSVRRFIEIVITKSARVWSPDAPEWVGGAFAYTPLIRALAHYPDSVTVVTLNYDCLLEYACYCLGIPFTYHRRHGRGVEILKLHGSSNWLKCPNQKCTASDAVAISPLKYVARYREPTGYVDRTDTICGQCGSRLVPVIIPPTWAKEIDERTLTPIWSRAVEVLSKAETFVAVGCSLPVSDSHIRHLLHIGFSSGRLRQALAIVGSDEPSAERWSRLFRESWRQARLDVRLTTFGKAMHPAIMPALVIPSDSSMHSSRSPMLPIPFGSAPSDDWRERLRAALVTKGLTEEEAQKTTGPNGADWVDVCKGLRAGSPAKHDWVKRGREALVETGLFWVPKGDILPIHGTEL